MAITLTESWKVVRDTTLYRSNVHLICYAKIASQSTENNCSYVDTWLGIKIDGSWSYTTDSVKAHVSGAPDISWGRTTFSSGETKLASGQFRVDHESDGSARTWVTMWITQTYGGSTDSIDTEWLYLPSIPRASSPTLSSTNLIAGQSVTISTNRKSTAFTHKVSYHFGSSSGVISSNAGDSCSWTPSTSLLNQIPNSTSGEGTITVETFNGSTKIGDTKSLSFTLSVPSDANPSIGTITLTEQHPGVNAKNANITVQQISKKLVSVAVSPKYSTSIKSVQCDGIALTESNGKYTGYVSNKTDGKYTVTAMDNRGLQSSNSITQDFYVYKRPVIAATLKRKSETDQNGTLTVSGSYSTIYSNTVSMTIKRNDQNIVNVTPKLDNGAISFSKSYTDLYYVNSYSIICTVTDGFGEKCTVTAYLGMGQYAFAMRKKGVVLGPDNYIFDKNGMMREFIDFFYPVGCFFDTTDASFNPNVVWGGTWELVKDRVRVGAGNSYAVKSTGGSSTHSHTTSPHALSGNEMPKHDHAMNMSYAFAGWSGTSPLAYATIDNPDRAGSGWGGNWNKVYTTSNGMDVIEPMGNDQSHSHGNTGSSSNMPPYYSSYMWHRTA